MIRRPRLKKFLTVVPLSDSTWSLQGGTEELWKIKLSDPRAVRALGGLLPFLNGQHQTAEILARLAEQGIDQGTAEALLATLEANSFLEEAEASPLSEEQSERFQDQITFFSRFTDHGGATLQNKLLGTRVALVGEGVLSRMVESRLVGSGIGELLLLTDDDADASHPADESASEAETQVSRVHLDRRAIWPESSQGEDALEPPDLLVYPQEAHDPELLEAIDGFSKKHKVPWLLLRNLAPHEGWVGPLFVPGDTASYVSLEARLRSNMRYFDEYMALDRHLRNGHVARRSGGLLAFLEVIAGIAVTEAIKYLSGFASPQLAGKFLTVSMLTWDTEVHEVLRVPRLELDSASEPRIFPWKEFPYVSEKTRRG